MEEFTGFTRDKKKTLTKETEIAHDRTLHVSKPLPIICEYKPQRPPPLRPDLMFDLNDKIMSVGSNLRKEDPLARGNEPVFNKPI